MSKKSDSSAWAELANHTAFLIKILISSFTLQIKIMLKTYSNWKLDY